MPRKILISVKTKLPLANIISTAQMTPACPTIHPDRKNTITPKIFIKQEVKTPSHVPNRTGCEMKKFDFHHGTSPYKSNLRTNKNKYK